MEHERKNQQGNLLRMWWRIVFGVWIILFLLTCLVSLFASLNEDDHLHFVAVVFGALVLIVLVPLFILDRQRKRL